MATVNLKSISELWGLSFWIPTYQRGYRWSTTQIQDLLEDLYEFSSSKGSDDDYYCLQPVIVKKRGDEWELVDGQQRLTALWLISALYYCSNRDDVDDLERQQYRLVYEKKEHFTGVFEEINDFVEDGSMRKIEEHFEYLKRKSIDARSLYDSMVFISKFKTGGKTAKGVLGKIFDEINNIKVIWYELAADEDPIRTFTNINANKIELTNAELIKAILLHANSNENTMQNMAVQWEEIEKGLNSSVFWNFVVNEKKRSYVTRIDFLFEIWCANHGHNVSNVPADKHPVFRFVNDYLTKGNKERNAEELWTEIKEIYETLSDWYNDYFYYHTIGLLIILSDHSGVDQIKKLYEVYSKTTKPEFRKEILKQIISHYFGSSCAKPFSKVDEQLIHNDLNDLGYSDTGNVKNVLLLYNIAMLVNANNTYELFPFDLYKAETWDIEHINPQTPPTATEGEQLAWLSSYEQLISSGAIEGASEEDRANILFAIKDFRNRPDKDFLAIANMVNDFLSISDNNSISNLVLLDSATNRGYKNACFAEKRKKIIEVERKSANDEKYIPVGTKWVFLKGFERANQLVVWSATDMQDYLCDIAKNICHMLGGATGE